MASRRKNRSQGRRPRALRDTRRVSVHRSAHGNVREAAAWVLERTLATSSSADSFLKGVRQRSDPRDHGLLVELVRGSLTWLERIDHVLAAAASRPVSEIEPALRAPLRIAIYQLLFMDRVAVHAVVNEAVEMARRVTHRGGVSFTNGVLRRIARSGNLSDWPVRADTEVATLAIEHSHPEFLVERWLERFGKERAVAIMAANNRRKPLHLLGFRGKGGRELLAEELLDEGLEVTSSELAPTGLRLPGGAVNAVLASGSFRRGHCYIQDEASQVAALVPPPREGERVLDLAAAPGGKLFAMSAFRPGVVHVGADLSLARLLLMRANCKRLGQNFPLLVADGAQPPFAGSFERVVVDAPCSGTGTFRKNPELKWRISSDEIERLAGEGRSILAGASGAVEPGGLLVWITCSLEREENEDVGAWFLGQQGPEFDGVDLAAELPNCLSSWVTGSGVWQMPTAEDHDGFTVQVFRRRGG